MDSQLKHSELLDLPLVQKILPQQKFVILPPTKENKYCPPLELLLLLFPPKKLKLRNMKNKVSFQSWIQVSFLLGSKEGFSFAPLDLSGQVLFAVEP